MTPLDALYASLEAGDCPLDVVVDWYEDAGSELADGVRWLAERRCNPPWWLLWDSAWYLSSDIHELAELVEPDDGFPSLRAAIEAAAEAVIADHFSSIGTSSGSSVDSSSSPPSPSVP